MADVTAQPVAAQSLLAWRVPHSTPGLRLDTASPRREWMDNTPNGFANRCLPLLLANASGWVLRQVGDVTAIWTGANGGPGDINIVPTGCPAPPTAHFGCGVLTWQVPWLFRTPPGWNLLIRGPANEPRDAVSPLEGIIESDWMTQTTTFSWKFTRPGVEVTWADGDTVAMIVPHRRDDLEEWDGFTEADMPPQVRVAVDEFRVSRAAYNSDPNRGPKDWQKKFFLGQHADGTPAPEHRRNRRLARPETR